MQDEDGFDVQIVDPTEAALDDAWKDTARREYETMFDLYQHAGWKALMAEIQSQIDQLQNVRNVTKENVDSVKGALTVLDAVAKHEEMTRRAYELVFESTTVH